VIFVDVKDVLYDGPVYPSEVLCRPCEDVVVVAQEMDELALSFVIQHSEDDNLLVVVAFKQGYFFGFFCWLCPGLLFWFIV
jgi:hypothetical protein